MNPEFKSALWNILGIFVVMGVIAYLRLSKWQIIAFLCLYVGAAMAWKTLGSDRLFNFWGYLVGCVRVVVFIHAFLYLAGFGWWGFVAANFLLAAYILWARWERFMKAIRDVEEMIFGKSLDKENWINEKPPGLLEALKGRKKKESVKE